MIKGIICFETGEFASYRTENQWNALPLLKFMESEMHIPYIYRQIATRQELEYYLNKIGEDHFKNKFDVVYFCFHGSPGQICLDKRGKITLTLDDLAELGAVKKVFLNRHIHFGSCETMDCNEDDIKEFRRNVGAKSVSGYTKCVMSDAAFINELAYFHQIKNFQSIQTLKKHMSNYQAELNKLGFIIY